MLLEGKKALVTGAARGIGKAIALEFAKHGCDVGLCDLDAERVREAAQEIVNMTGRIAIGVPADVSEADQVERMVEVIMKKLGRIEILVNNAGILRHAFLLDMDEEDWDLVMKVNVKSVFLVSRAVVPQMIKRGYGKIINISSASGKKPTLKEGAYCASKSAIIGLTRVMALEWGPYGINVNALCPGATDTDMTRSTFLTSPEVEREWIEKTALKRLGKPEDHAKVAVFLASSLADHVTGESLIVSGGELMTQ